MDISAPKKVFTPPPPIKIPQFAADTLPTPRPLLSWRTPPLLGSARKIDPPPPGASDSPFPLPEEKKNPKRPPSKDLAKRSGELSGMICLQIPCLFFLLRLFLGWSRCLFVVSRWPRSPFWYRYRDSAFCCSASRSSSSWDQPVSALLGLDILYIGGQRRSRCRKEDQKISIPKKDISMPTRRGTPLKQGKKTF